MNKQTQPDKWQSFLGQIDQENFFTGMAAGEMNEGFRIKGRQSAISTEIMRRFRIQNHKLMEQVALLKDKLKAANHDQESILNDLKILIKTNRELAAALGSCPDCWGENDACNECKGLGVPGWRKSNKKHFTRYVLPVLEQQHFVKRKAPKK